MPEYYLTCNPQVGVTGYEFDFNSNAVEPFSVGAEPDGSAKIQLTENTGANYLYTFAESGLELLKLRAIGPAPAFQISGEAYLQFEASVLLGVPNNPVGMSVELL